jgi:uncharacterized protein YutE (UPF0331/DUF86 family)
MISKDVVNAMIDMIDENIRLVEEIRSQGYESFSGGFRDIQAAKHSLQEAIEACLDIGSHIIAEKGFRRPEDYKEIFKVLEENGIIDHVLSVKLQIDIKRVYIIMSNDLKDIQKFAKNILKYIY